VGHPVRGEGNGLLQDQLLMRHKLGTHLRLGPVQELWLEGDEGVPNLEEAGQWRGLRLRVGGRHLRGLGGADVCEVVDQLG